MSYYWPMYNSRDASITGGCLGGCHLLVGELLSVGSCLTAPGAGSVKFFLCRKYGRPRHWPEVSSLWRHVQNFPASCVLGLCWSGTKRVAGGAPSKLMC